MGAVFCCARPAVAGHGAMGLWGYEIPHPAGVESVESVEGVERTASRARARTKIKEPRTKTSTRPMKPQITQMNADLQTPPPTRKVAAEQASGLHSCVQWRPGMQAGRLRYKGAHLPGALPEVAPFDNVGTLQLSHPALEVSTLSKTARPINAPQHSGWAGWELSTFDSLGRHARQTHPQAPGGRGLS